jgi:methylated-DNA-protein-cysteine methyltransferase related protein
MRIARPSGDLHNRLRAIQPRCIRHAHASPSCPIDVAGRHVPFTGFAQARRRTSHLADCSRLLSQRPLEMHSRAVEEARARIRNRLGADRERKARQHSRPHGVYNSTPMAAKSGTRSAGRAPKPKFRATRPGDGAAAIYAVVRAIPRGKVATYGQVAELAGIPSGHRVVARAMRSCPSGLPWQRVVGRKDTRRARISVQDPAHIAEQRSMLRREGVVFDDNGFIVLARSGWLPV